MIPPFNLPSDPRETIRLREATVADALQFSDISEDREEAGATLFLNRVQDDVPMDTLKWTGDDRCFALLWYYIHTEEDHRWYVSYECGACEETHRHEFDLKELLDGYKKLNGRAIREIEFDGKKVFVRPLTGQALEILELERIALDMTEKESGEESAEVRIKRIKMNLNALIYRLVFQENLEDPDRDRKQVEAWVNGLGVKKLERLIEKVAGSLAEMAHGLETLYDDGRLYFMSPEHPCPNDKEAKTRVRVPFHANEFIPKI